MDCGLVVDRSFSSTITPIVNNNFKEKHQSDAFAFLYEVGEKLQLPLTMLDETQRLVRRMETYFRRQYSEGVIFSRPRGMTKRALTTFALYEVLKKYHCPRNLDILIQYLDTSVIDLLRVERVFAMWSLPCIARDFVAPICHYLHFTLITIRCVERIVTSFHDSAHLRPCLLVASAIIVYQRYRRHAVQHALPADKTLDDTTMQNVCDVCTISTHSVQRFLRKLNLTMVSNLIARGDALFKDMLDDEM